MTHNYKSKLGEKIAAFLDLKLKQGFILDFFEINVEKISNFR